MEYPRTLRQTKLGRFLVSTAQLGKTTFETIAVRSERWQDPVVQSYHTSYGDALQAHYDAVNHLWRTQRLDPWDRPTTTLAN